MSAPARKEIIVLGDGLSDIDGPGVKGYGPGRTFASVWTRALRAYIDPPKSQRGSNPLQRFERFNVYRGGRAYGGTELAVSGQTTKQGNDALDKVLNQVRNPAMVVIAYTGVTDVGKISITQAKKNLENMVERALASGASVLLIRFPKPNDTGHWDAKDKKNGPTIQFLDALNAFYGELYNRFKKSGKVGFISDFYEPLRVNGAVPRNIVRAGLDVVADAADEYKLFDNVFRTMGPILDPAYKPPKTDRKAIMVVGDHLSDIDGPNTRGYGGDRAQSIWTRGLIKLVDGVKGGKNPNPYYVYDGGRAGGGSELAASAASTTVQLNFLRRALQTTRPGVVVIAASYINEEQLSAETTFSNIREMVALAKSVGAKILLIGFPPASKDYDKKTADRATALANGYKSIAKREKLSYVEDFFAPIRGSDGFVIPNLLTRDRGLFRSEATEQKLFDNIFKELAPLLGMKPPSSGGDFGKPKNPPTASKRTIMVVGDHYADVDGPGAGKGSGRNASIWTRELLARSASQNYRVIEGGEGNGGSELAMGGGASAWQKQVLESALRRDTPGTVVLAGSYIHDWEDNYKTKSVSAMVKETVANFEGMVAAAKRAGASILIVGYKPGFQYAETNLTTFANALHNALRSLAKREKVAFVDDFYAPLRDKSGYVPTALQGSKWQLKQDPSIETKLFDNIWKTLRPLVRAPKTTQRGPDAANRTPSTIMVVGDHYSDMDGPGAGKGPGRDASVWTRALATHAQARNYKIFEGGNNGGGSELAMGGGASARQKDFLTNALTQARPGIVVLAGSYIHDWLQRDTTKSLAETVAHTTSNFTDMVNAALRAGAKVLIVGYKPGFNYNNKYGAIETFATQLHAQLKKLAAEKKVAFVDDFYAPLRNAKGQVDAKYKGSEWQLKRSEATEKLLFDNINKVLTPLMPALSGRMNSKRTIMVVGDHYSDMDGPGAGKGPGRDASVWTRELAKAATATNYTIYEGGEGGGGSDLAMGGATSATQRQFLSNALAKQKPAVVVLAGSYIHDWLGGMKDKKSPSKLLAEVVANFRHMVEAAKASGAMVLIIGYKPGFDYSSKYGAIETFATNLHSSLKQLANEKNVAFVDDFYAPLRDAKTKFVADSYKGSEWQLKRNANTEQLLFKNINKILKTLIPDLPNSVSAPTLGRATSQRTIMVVGDHYADVDGPGAGKGSGRNASIWTRELLARSASQNYRVIEGGEGNGGSELAMGGGASAWQKQVLESALRRETPGTVVLAGSYIHDWEDNYKTKSVSAMVKETVANFEGMVAAAKQAGASILIVGYKPGFQYAETNLTTFATTLHNALRSLAKREKVAFVDDFYAPLRDKSGYVPTALQGSKWQLKRDPSIETKLFDNIWKTLRPLVRAPKTTQPGPDTPTQKPSSIMVVGDHYSDVDGPGTGFGGGRGHASIWTRELLAHAAARNYTVMQGGSNGGGCELAAGGADSGKQKDFLLSALTRNVPSVVVLAGSYIHDWIKGRGADNTPAAIRAETVANFTAMVNAAKDKGAKVLIVGFKPGYRYTEAGLNDFANALHADLKKLAKDQEVSFVQDFYAPLRASGYVPVNHKADPRPESTRRWELKYDAGLQKKLFDNIFKELAPLLGTTPTSSGGNSDNPKKPGSLAIMVVGDSISDLDGAFERGYGNGRSDAVWTRALAEQLDGPETALVNDYAPYRRFHLYEGGANDGGRELAVSGTTSDQHLDRLKKALAKATPAVVVLAVTNYNDIAKKVPFSRTKENIEKMVSLAQGVGAEVVIIGFPPAIESDAATSRIASAAEDIAKTYKTHFVKDYYAPLRNKNGFVPASYFYDRIHLNAQHRHERERQLLANIFNEALKRAMDRAAAKFDVTADFPQVSKFTASAVKAGARPVLQFDLKSPIKKDIKLPLKFWAQINDPDAKDRNGDIVDAAKYVNFKNVFFRYNSDDEWRKVSYSTDKTTINAKKNATRIYLRFETYKQAPFSFNLFVNFGGKSYSIKVNDLPKGTLYLRDPDDKSERSVADVRQDTDSNTCYALAALQAAVSRTQGNNYIESLITKHKDHYTVNFKNFAPVRIEKEEVETASLWNADAAAAGRSGRELWVRVIELAYLRATNSDIQADGSPLQPLEMFTGEKATQINGGERGTKAIKTIINGKGEHYIVVGTRQKLGSGLSSYRSNHAYAITGINSDGTFRLWDPIDGKLVKTPEADLRKISERFFVTNFDATGLDKPGDLDADGIPDGYLRITLLSEHKIKTPESDNRYYNWIDEDPNGKLVNIETFYNKYKKKFPDGGNEAELNSTNYTDNIFKKYKKVKAGDNDPHGFAKGATYFTIELWRRYVGADNMARFYRVYTRHYDVKSQVRLSQSTEITLGLEFRGYVDIENPTRGDAERIRAGVVLGYTKNYEFMTTWAKKGHMTEGSPWRTRVRFSIAGEAIAYGSGRGAGFLMGVRFKGQVQVGRINNGVSWWITFGIETSHAIDFSNAQGSLIEYADAVKDGRTEEAKGHLGPLLSKAMGANTYLGMNGLVQDGIKVITRKLADKVISNKQKDEEGTHEQFITLYGDDAEIKRDQEEQLQRARKNRNILSTTLIEYGEYFHNFKWKVELGVLWLPFVTGTPQGDGKYAGAGKDDNLVDRVHAEIVAVMKWQESLQSVINTGSIQALRQLLPASALTIIDAVGVSRSFGDAINSAIVAADEQVANDANNGRYRALASELTAPMTGVLMGSLMPTVIDRIMERLLREAEAVAQGASPSFPIPFGGETAEEYGKRLAPFAASLVGDALASVFTSREAMVTMLLYGATLFTTEAIARFLDELDKRIFGDAALTDAQERTILNTARAEDYKRFGISDDVARALANGDSLASITGRFKLSPAEVATLSKQVDQASLAAAMRKAEIDPNAAIQFAKGTSFDKVASDMGWNEPERANVRGKLESTAKTYGGEATKVADDAFKSGMNSDQKVAYDALKGISNVPRDTLRRIILRPENYDTLTQTLAGDAKEELESKIETARANSTNPTIKTLSERTGNAWLSGLTPEQRSVARALFKDLYNPDEPDGRKGHQDIARKLAEGGLKPEEVQRAADSIRDLTTSLKSVGRVLLPEALLLAVLAIPIIIALTRDDSEALKKAVAGMATEAVFVGATVAAAAAFGGPAALAFCMLIILSEIVGSRYENQLKKNPWFLFTATGELVAPLVAAKLVTDGVTDFFASLFGRGNGDRSILFDPMTRKEVAYLAFAGVYDDQIAAGKSADAASMALIFELIKRGVVSFHGLFKGVVTDKKFDFDKSVFDLGKLTNDEWAGALAEYVNQRVKVYGERHAVAEIIAATFNAFNNINESSGLGSLSGDQVRFWLRGRGAYLNETIDPSTPYFISGRFRSDWRSEFNNLLVGGILGFSQGQLRFNFSGADNFAEYFAGALRWASGSSDDWIDRDELAKAFNMVNAGETHNVHSARYERLRVAIRFYSRYPNLQPSEAISTSQLRRLIEGSHLRAINSKTWIESAWKDASLFDLDIDWMGIARGSWGTPNDVIRELVIDAAMFGASGAFRDQWLGDALCRLGLLPMSAWGDDAKDVAKFLIRAVDLNADLGDFNAKGVLDDLIRRGVIQIPRADQPLTLDLQKLDALQVAQSIKALSGSKDDIIGVVDLLRAFNYILPERRAFDMVEKDQWVYAGSYQPWFKRTGDARADLNAWLGEQMGNSLVFHGGGEWRFNSVGDLQRAILEGKFNDLLGSRYKQASPEGLLPVVLDLTGHGICFESLATSGALYDSNNDGTKELVAWAGRGTGILSYDFNSDGMIERTNEIAFTSYKPGAKTDLEGLSAFDTNKNGLLDAGDTSWKKFGVWIDADQDGVSDAGEFRSLDDLRIAHIGLSSDNVVRRLSGVTVHGLSSFVTTSGKRGTVGDVSFDVAREALSEAEIARRRDLLAQTVAGAGSSKSASISLRAAGTDAFLDLNLVGLKK